MHLSLVQQKDRRPYAAERVLIGIVLQDSSHFVCSHYCLIIYFSLFGTSRYKLDV